MLNDPLAGRGLRAPERSRMLVATEDGVFLWPGTALLYRRGNGFFAADPRDVNSALACFFGPAAIDLPLQNILERARDELRVGRVEAVQQQLDRLRLPPISPNGARLERAISTRQQIAIPDFPVAERQDGTVWTEQDVVFIARLHDAVYPRAQRLEKVFNPAIGDPAVGWDPAKHPRWPAGQPDGGEFAPAGEGDGSAIVPAAAVPPPWSLLPRPSLGDPPKIPDQEPRTKADKYAAIKEVGYWIGHAALLASDAPEAAAAATLIEAVRGAKWLGSYVIPFFDGPKTFDQLTTGALDPETGYDIHHIVEQTSAAKDGFPRSQIDDPSNLVKIPTLKHWELNWWLGRPNGEYGGLTPREYVKGKSWEIRTKVGLDGLRAVGVLK
jgi:hypothetical protein